MVTDGLRALTPGAAATRVGLDGFGSALATSTNSLLVGMPGDELPGIPNSGSARFCTFSTSAIALRTTLDAFEGQSNAFYSGNIAMSGDLAFVGAPNETGPAGANQGAIYAYRFVNNAWMLTEKMVPIGNAFGREFGRTLAFDGTTLLTGGSNTVGEVAFFTRQTCGWTRGLSFARSCVASVAVAGNVAVVGRFGTAGANAFESAYIYSRDTAGVWAQRAEVTDGVAEVSGFGSSVATNGTIVLVGAPFRDRGHITDTGAVYVFRHNLTLRLAPDLTRWLSETTHQPVELNSQDHFGAAVAVAGNRVLIGTPGRSFATGAAFALDRTHISTFTPITWTARGVLLPKAPGLLQRFGSSVALTTNRAVVGTLSFSGLPPPGEARVFWMRSGEATWRPLQTITSPFGQNADRFARAIAITPHRALFGAPGFAFNSGATSSFRLRTNLADFNDDGVVDNADFLDFTNAIPLLSPECDLNDSGAVDVNDVMLFNELFLAGGN